MRVTGTRSVISLETFLGALLFTYTGVELVAFSYLRVDTVLVGSIVGASPGATYSLVYRVVDAAVARDTVPALAVSPRSVPSWRPEVGSMCFVAGTSALVPRLAILVAVVTMFAWAGGAFGTEV